MSVESLKLEQVSEYIAKNENGLPLKICQSLSSSIYDASNSDISFTPTDIELLSDIQSQLYSTYKDDFLPKMFMGEESQQYSLELDFLNVDSNSEMRLHSAGEGASQRFISFMFITDVIEKGIEITLNNNENLGVYKVGDILIFPPYYDHLICFKTGDEEKFCSVTLHACMLY